MTNILDYGKILERFPWIISRDQHCVISPDCDGQLCALLMSHYFGWKVKGFYDGKALLIEKGIDPSSVVYLDIEIYRKGIRSVGQHMTLPNKDALPSSWGNFEHCICANTLRRFDARSDFQNKYPFGTIHLLLAIVGSVTAIKKIPDDAVAPLLYADGTFKNMLAYPENSLSWLAFLQARKSVILNDVFFVHRATIAKRMDLMKTLFGKILGVGGGRGKEKINLSEQGGGQAANGADHVYIEKTEREKSEEILRMFADMTGWGYTATHWVWGNLTSFQIMKGILKTTGFGKRNALLEEAPISFAITARNRMEYTTATKEVFD